MKTRLWLVACMLCLPVAASGGDLRLEVGGWDYSISGDVQTRGETIDFERDVDLEVRSRLTLDARWDTDARWLPDLAGSYFHIDAGGRRVITTQPPGPLPVPPTTSVILADADLQDAELTLRYPWRTDRVTAWGGLTIKHLSGDLTTRTEDDTQELREPVSETLPMLHGALEVPLGERFAFNAALNWIASGDDRALGWRVGADLRVFGPVGVTAAWQRRQYRVTTTNDRLDATLDGGLVGIYARWGGGE